MFARRAAWDLSPNELAQRVEAHRAAGRPIVDLTESNPTRVGLRAPAAALAAALAELAASPDAARYEPDPRGDAAARAAIARYHAERGARLLPEHVVLTAGTSEGYAHLFRLLGDPGDAVHLPSPGYGLFDHLATMEGLAAHRYALLPPASGARWRIDLGALAASLVPRSRAVLLIHPHNPTGAFVDPADLAALRALARERRLTIVSDEVFADAAYGHGAPPSVLAGADEGPLHVVLSGASKPLALPQLKVAWLAVAGPPALRDDALARLEFIADAYLSVSPLLARTLPRLFAARPAIAAELRARVAGNRAHLAAAARAHPRIELLAAEAGWAAILRVRGLDDEEAFVLDLFERTGVLVHPGFVFDLDPGHLVVSLLPEPEVFARGTGTVVNG